MRSVTAPIDGAKQTVDLPEKIVSGGQTGADRAALDVALEKGMLHVGHQPG